ncbi:uncharacterized protein LOC103956213 [Pyrus x bretschneideri]|uniref:uncharacterized protein LOC103956213 n=1 Tax=Pyrus x bretschneideri TaxID=225117 RepID=UPI0005114AC8|nr:uncharacterized protein LOC103956213 [Pyrus x bretschneideri]
MCPLRFILVFFSAILAGYFAWRTVCSSPDGTDMMISQLDSTNNENAIGSPKQEEDAFNFKTMIQNGFWVFVDMASGKYLWRNIKEMNQVKVKC